MNQFEPTSAVYAEAEAGRSNKVRQHLENIKQTMSTVAWDLAELLLEATEKNYFAEWGYPSRKAYVEANLDMSDRNVDYHMRVVKISSAMDYQRAEIDNIDFSKLREIFSLNPDNFYLNPETQENEPISDHIRRLIVIAPSTGHEAIKAEVRRLKGLVGENDLTWNNYQTTRIVKENVITPGLEAFRQYLGSKGVTEKEGSTEYSDAFVYEMIFAEILSGAASNQGEDLQDEVVVLPEEGEDDFEEEAA